MWQKVTFAQVEIWASDLCAFVPQRDRPETLFLQLALQALQSVRCDGWEREEGERVRNRGLWVGLLPLVSLSEHLTYCVSRFSIGQFIYQPQRGQFGLAAVEAAGREAVSASGCHNALQRPETTDTGRR